MSRSTRKLSNRISLSMPRRLTRSDTFRLLWIFCLRNHCSIPLSPWDGMCRTGLACAGWSGLIHYAESIMLFFIVERLNYVDSITVKAMNKHKITIRNKVIIVLITFKHILQCKYKSKRISLYKSHGICMFSLTWWTVFLRWKCRIHRPVYSHVISS